MTAILSIFGNAAVLVSAARRLTGLKAPELLTVNLAVTDIGMALSMYPLSIASAFNHTWIGGDISCLYYGLMGMIFSITSIMTLAVMGMVRYMVTGSPPRKGNVSSRIPLGNPKSLPLIAISNHWRQSINRRAIDCLVEVTQLHNDVVPLRRNLRSLRKEVLTQLLFPPSH